MNPGALRARIELFAPQSSYDDIGGATLNFVSAGHVWGRIEAAGAAAGGAYEGQQARAQYRVELRVRRDIRPGLKIAWGERSLRVSTVADADEFGAYLALACEEEFL